MKVAYIATKFTLILFRKDIYTVCLLIFTVTVRLSFCIFVYIFVYFIPNRAPLRQRPSPTLWRIMVELTGGATNSRHNMGV